MLENAPMSEGRCNQKTKTFKIGRLSLYAEASVAKETYHLGYSLNADTPHAASICPLQHSVATTNTTSWPS